MAEPVYPDGEAVEPLTVVIPYFRQPRRVVAAVESILRQDYAPTTVLVVSDGDTTVPAEPLRALDPDRVFVHVLPQNRGHFFAREVATRALDTAWIGFVDGDDFVEPTWASSLIEAARDQGGVAFCGARQVHSYGPLSRTYTVSTVGRDKAAAVTPRQFARHTTIYRPARIKAAGGFDPGFRIGYDTVFVNLVALTGPFGVVDEPLYVRRRRDVFAREKSLTTSAQTGKGTPLRKEVLRRIDELYARYAPQFRQDPSAARETLLASRDPALDAEVEDRARELRQELGEWNAKRAGSERARRNDVLRAGAARPPLLRRRRRGPGGGRAQRRVDPCAREGLARAGGARRHRRLRRPVPLRRGGVP